MGRVIKALYLIFKPLATWEQILKARRSPAFLLAFYLLPLLLLAAAAEGYGLVEWGRHQAGIHRVHKLTTGEAVIYEMARLLITLLIVGVCAVLIKMFGDTFRERNTYRQAFTLAIYGLGPVFLLRLLAVMPISSWVVWAIGIALSLEVVYRGIPGVLEPDPPNAIGLFFMIGLVMASITGLEQFFTYWYLSGHTPALETFISNLAARLPF